MAMEQINGSNAVNFMALSLVSNFVRSCATNLAHQVVEFEDKYRILIIATPTAPRLMRRTWGLNQVADPPACSERASPPV